MAYWGNVHHCIIVYFLFRMHYKLNASVMTLWWIRRHENLLGFHFGFIIVLIGHNWVFCLILYFMIYILIKTFVRFNYAKFSFIYTSHFFLEVDVECKGLLLFQGFFLLRYRGSNEVTIVSRSLPFSVFDSLCLLVV